jgi:anti-anti-sigma factor
LAATEEFRLHVHRNGHGPVVWLSGELDIVSAITLRRCFEDHADTMVTVDCSHLTFLDSSGLSAMVWMHQNGGLILRGVQPAQMSVLAITGLDEVFTIEGDAGST